MHNNQRQTFSRYFLLQLDSSLVTVRQPDLYDSRYYKIALQVTEWLSVVDECKINAFTKHISETLKEIQLEGDEELISFDVSSLYINVPVQDAISDCTALLYSGKYTTPPVDEDTFKQLLEICSCNVLMLTNEGYY